MTAHHHPAGTPTASRRDEPFLIDGCPRCEEYVEELGVHFDPERFREFWRKMIRVEWQSKEAYASDFDKQLGRRLYLVSLAMERGFGMHPTVPLQLRAIGDAVREVFTCRLNPGCNLSRPHVHHSDGAVIYVESAEDADSLIAEEERVRRLYPGAFGGGKS